MLIALAMAFGPVAVGIFQASASLPPEPRVLARVSLVVAASIAAIVWLLSRVARDAYGTHAALLVLGVAFSAFPMIAGRVGVGSSTVTAAIYLLIAIALAIGVARAPGFAREEIAAFAVPVSLAIVVVGGVMVASGYALRGTSMLPEERYQVASGSLAVYRANATSPDIYHVILDGLGRPDALNQSLGVSLRAADALEARGFTLSGNVIANYTQTYLSMASVLNMTYLDSVTSAMTGQQARAPLVELTQRSTVINGLKNGGYSFHFIGSGQPASASHRLADRCDCAYPFIGEFEAHLLRLTPLGHLPWYGPQHVPHRQHVRSQFELLRRLVDDDPRPRLLVAHVMSPHPPFVLGREGEDVVPPRPYTVADGNAFPGPRAEYLAGYRAQAEYVLSVLPGLADAFVEQSRRRGRKALIVFHGDHGPRSRFDAADARRTDADEVLPVFLAIRWPDRAPEVAIGSLVNLYRVILSRQFAATLPALPDRAFISSFSRPYDLIEVAVPGSERSRLGAP